MSERTARALVVAALAAVLLTMAVVAGVVLGERGRGDDSQGEAVQALVATPTAAAGA